MTRRRLLLFVISACALVVVGVLVLVRPLPDTVPEIVEWCEEEPAERVGDAVTYLAQRQPAVVLAELVEQLDGALTLRRTLALALWLRR